MFTRSFVDDFFSLARVPLSYSSYSRATYTDDGEKITYYLDGKVHNEKSPAVEWYRGKNKGKVEYWLEGKEVTKEAVDKLREEEEVAVWVEGKEYRVTRKRLKELRLVEQLQS